MTAFSREKKLCNCCSSVWLVYTFSKELRARLIILKNFTTIVKLLFLLNAASSKVYLFYSLWPLLAEFVSVKYSLRKMIAVSIFSIAYICRFKWFIIFALTRKFQKKKTFFIFEFFITVFYRQELRFTSISWIVIKLKFVRQKVSLYFWNFFISECSQVYLKFLYSRF